MLRTSRTILLALLLGIAALLSTATPAVLAQTEAASVQAITAPPGPDANTRITESYARLVARDAWFWAWPMVNVYNRRLVSAKAPDQGLVGGVLPMAPYNRVTMLSDYIKPEQRAIACPNQDVVYGAGYLALDVSPVVIQVPDFGKRFWVYQFSDLRTDGITGLGAMYDTKPGFYLIVGPNWQGEVPKGITQIIRTKSNAAFVGPRVFQDDSPEDRQAVQEVIQGINVYPLAEYDGTMKLRDWRKLPIFPKRDDGKDETRWVRPETFFDQLPLVLDLAPAQAGEEARYSQVLAVIAAAQKDPALKQAMIDEAEKADRELVDPLLQFRNWGLPLQHHWTTITNGARFGTDYFTRTAVARSNILVNASNETRYFYQDLDAAGVRLNGGNAYTITFEKGKLPPVKGFWSLTVYDAAHFFVPNPLNRYSLGTKNKDLKTNADGSLTFYVQAESPGADKESNWLPAPKAADFSLFLRAYWPDEAITQGRWTPPAVDKSVMASNN
ncbi:DUF1254 domain-containing protein [Pseudomonas sp. C2B4]|uniref:DUF1254 domain-containing protein n=1 Tax=Pseudomonas sp. C2B4 TaxID=2735270 RepID=UPI00158628A2|nr:DUF1254 domain-containing protein [Pseudomonas sp. C2B4]NUU37825.1 DUF1254 domain-containing protein [Pseudomonas sp. C2B4]